MSEIFGDDYQARLERNGSPCFGVIEAVDEMLPEEKQVKFSIIHPTARVTPDFEHAWWNACESLLLGCDDPKRVEYILVVDEAQIREFYWAQAGNFHPTLQRPFDGYRGIPPVCGSDSYHLENPAIWGRFTVVTNFGYGGSVAAHNAGVIAASGEIHFRMDDDMRFPKHWDTQLLKLIPDTSRRICVQANVPGHRKDLLTPAIATKALVAAIGALCPEYTSMYADDEWSFKARQLGTVIEAHEFRVEHFHPSVQTAAPDSVYLRQNREDAYRTGKEIFERRMAQGFPRVSLAGWPETISANGGASIPPRQRILALCTPGETHCGQWSRERDRLVFGLASQGWVIRTYWGYTTNVYQTRMEITRDMLKDSATEGPPDFLLWIDDDNIPSLTAVESLLSTLDAHPEYSGAAGWCWIKWRVAGNKAEWLPSVGNFKPGTLYMLPTLLGDLYADNAAPKQIEWSGFPCLLVRYDAAKQLGMKAFMPLFCEENEFGFTGEDVAWFVCAHSLNLKFCVVPQAKVEHLKLNAIEPDYDIGPKADPVKAKNVEADRARRNGARVEIAEDVKALMEAGM